MIHKLSTMISSHMVKKKVVNKELEEVYIYGIEIIISSIVGFLLTAAIGVLLNAFDEAMIYYAVFVILRSMTGGFHASSYFKCNLVFNFITLFVLIFSKAESEIYMTIGTITLLFLSSISIFILLAPIENPNKPIDEEKKPYLKVAAVSVSIFLYVLSILLYINSYIYHAAVIVTTIFSVSMLCMLTIAQKGGEDNEEN